MSVHESRIAPESRICARSVLPHPDRVFRRSCNVVVACSSLQVTAGGQACAFGCTETGQVEEGHPALCAIVVDDLQWRDEIDGALSIAVLNEVW